MTIGFSNRLINKYSSRVGGFSLLTSIFLGVVIVRFKIYFLSCFKIYNNKKCVSAGASSNSGFGKKVKISELSLLMHKIWGCTRKKKRKKNQWPALEKTMLPRFLRFSMLLSLFMQLAAWKTKLILTFYLE